MIYVVLIHGVMIIFVIADLRESRREKDIAGHIKNRCMTTVVVPVKRKVIVPFVLIVAVVLFIFMQVIFFQKGQETTFGLFFVFFEVIEQFGQFFHFTG